MKLGTIVPKKGDREGTETTNNLTRGPTMATLNFTTSHWHWISLSCSVQRGIKPWSSRRWLAGTLVTWGPAIFFMLHDTTDVVDSTNNWYFYPTENPRWVSTPYSTISMITIIDHLLPYTSEVHYTSLATRLSPSWPGDSLTIRFTTWKGGTLRIMY